eukprot:364023-Chlamydomonas_euryale.AAC.6
MARTPHRVAPAAPPGRLSLARWRTAGLSRWDSNQHSTAGVAVSGCDPQRLQTALTFGTGLGSASRHTYASRRAP